MKRCHRRREFHSWTKLPSGKSSNVLATWLNCGHQESYWLCFSTIAKLARFWWGEYNSTPLPWEQFCSCSHLFVQSFSSKNYFPWFLGEKNEKKKCTNSILPLCVVSIWASRHIILIVLLMWLWVWIDFSITCKLGGPGPLYKISCLLELFFI